MAACKTLVHTSLASISSSLRTHGRFIPLLNSPALRFSPLHSPNKGLRLIQNNVPSRPYASISAEAADFTDEAAHSPNATLDPSEDPTQDTVEHLLTHRDDVARIMKLERRPLLLSQPQQRGGGRWFPYLDKFNCGGAYLNSGEILEALDPYIMDVRKERFRNVVRNRSYSVCLVVEGLGDFGNVSAVFRSADALGIQSVHVLSCDASKRCNAI